MEQDQHVPLEVATLRPSDILRSTSLAFHVPASPCLPRVPFNAPLGEVDSNGIFVVITCNRENKIAKYWHNILNHESAKFSTSKISRRTVSRIKCSFMRIHVVIKVKLCESRTKMQFYVD